MDKPADPRESVSIVVPVFNEAASIADVIQDLLRIVETRPGSELVVVDDGSTDDTPTVLDSIARRETRVRVVRSARNRGHGPSLMAGLGESAGRWLFLVDADGQIAASEFDGLWGRRGTADLVMGARAGRRERPHRRALSSAARALAARASGVRLPDPNAPFKLVRREVWQDLRPHIPAEAATPSLLIAVGAVLRGWRVESVRVRHEPRLDRRGALSIGSLARISVRAALELFLFRRRLSRAAPRPEQQPELRATE